jgi:hypothetical protein
MAHRDAVADIGGALDVSARLDDGITANIKRAIANVCTWLHIAQEGLFITQKVGDSRLYARNCLPHKFTIREKRTRKIILEIEEV